MLRGSHKSASKSLNLILLLDLERRLETISGHMKLVGRLAASFLDSLFFDFGAYLLPRLNRIEFCNTCIGSVVVIDVAVTAACRVISGLNKARMVARGYQHRAHRVVPLHAFHHLPYHLTAV